MRSLIVTHNIGHSVLEGFENRFAPVVLEDRSQVGLGAVLYAGSRIGAEAIVASNSYVVGEIPAGRVRDRRAREGDGQLQPQALGRAPARARAPHDRRPPRAARAARPRRCRRSRRRPGFEIDGHARRCSRRATAAASMRRRWCSRSTFAVTCRKASPCSTSSVVACTGAAASSSTPCGSSAASAGSSFEPGPWSYPGGLV